MKTRVAVPLMTQFNQKMVKYITMLICRVYKYPPYNAISLSWKCWKTNMGIEILLFQWADAPKRPSVFSFQGGRTWKEVNFEQSIRDKIVMLLGRPWGTHWEHKKSNTLLVWYVKWNISFHFTYYRESKKLGEHYYLDSLLQITQFRTYKHPSYFV
jgi:hypothetical protein